MTRRAIYNWVARIRGRAGFRVMAAGILMGPVALWRLGPLALWRSSRAVDR
jgi:hypothetical protein